VTSAEPHDSLARLREIMRALRHPTTGCPWDLEQDFASIAPFTIEEAYEVAEAIERGTPQQLRDELGDLLFQVVFHAQLGAERGWFDFDSIATAIADKLVRRHPHVFDGASIGSAEEQTRAWEEHKSRERAASGGDLSLLADVPIALPALSRAVKLGKRAARVHFDWPDVAGVRAKIDEELHEADTATEAPERAGEVGDVLFAVANWARHLGVDPEEALRQANYKFERRFRAIEGLAAARGVDLAQIDAATWEAFWQEIKQAER
jgi:nucleoside triphosphate diphosphatase